MRGSVNDSRPDDSGWDFEPHACRNCRARVMSRERADGVREYRCSCCGFRGEGKVESVCSCGHNWGAHGHVLKCLANPNVSVEIPFEILVRGELPKRQQVGPMGGRNPVNSPSERGGLGDYVQGSKW